MTTSVPESLKAAGLAAANLVLFIAVASLFTSNLVLFSHHWLFPFHEGVLLVQALLLARAGRLVRTLTALSALVILVGAARLETIIEAGHLFHFCAALLLGSVLHGLLARPKRSTWRKWNRAASVIFLAAALAAGWTAFAKGVDFGG